MAAPAVFAISDTNVPASSPLFLANFWNFANDSADIPAMVFSLTNTLAVLGPDALLLYKEVGEDIVEPAVEDKVKEKADASEAVAKQLESKSAQVKKHSETPVGQRKKPGKKRNAPPTKQAPPDKRAKTKTPTKKQSPFSFIGLRIAKYFGEDVFFGTIKKYIERALGP